MEGSQDNRSVEYWPRFSGGQTVVLMICTINQKWLTRGPKLLGYRMTERCKMRNHRGIIPDMCLEMDNTRSHVRMFMCMVLI